MQRRAGARFGVAQTGQAVRGDRLQARGFRLLRRAFGDFAHVGLELALGVGQILRGLAMQAERDQRLVLANVRRERLVARGLPRLPLQRIDLRVDLLHHVFETRQVFLRALQAQFRLVPARMQAGDAGGFFQNAAARLRLGGNDLADHALPHQRRRTRAGRGVGEQQLHVARAHLARIDAIGRARLALDATGDLDQFAVVEGGGRGARRIVEHQPDLGRVARGAIAGAGEDHVVHAGRAHVLVRILAHDPAQGLDEIRLAAAVGPDDAGEARLDLEFGRLDEALEADEPQLVEFHERFPPPHGSSI